MKIYWACNSHLESNQRYINYQLSLNIGIVRELSNACIQENVEENNIYLEILIRIFLYLTKQTISFRGHLEDSNSINQGTFRELCNLFASDDCDFKKNLHGKFNYNSPPMKNKFLNIFAALIRKQII